MIPVNYIVIGQPKAGSTWLHQMFLKHKQIFVIRHKQTYFFDRYFSRGTEWYFSQFKERKMEMVSGEICHNYIYSEDAATRISETLSNNVKIIVVLRKPIDWFISDYRYALRNGTFKGELDDYFKAHLVEEMLDYTNLLSSYYSHFSNENISCISTTCSSMPVIS